MQEGRDGVSESQGLCLSSLVLILQTRDSERAGVGKQPVGKRAMFQDQICSLGKDHSDFKISLVVQRIKVLPTMQET